MSTLQTIKDTIASSLPDGWYKTPTGQKLIMESEEGQRKADAAAQERRGQLSAELAKAQRAEHEDPELAALREKEQALVAQMAEATALLNTAPHALHKIRRSIDVRVKQHRDVAAKIHAELGDSPDWQRIRLDDDLAELREAEQRVRQVPTEPLDQKMGYVHGTGEEKPIKVLDFTEYRTAMLGTPADPHFVNKPRVRGWIEEAIVASKKLRREVLTPEQLESRLSDIRKTQPKPVATWRNV